MTSAGSTAALRVALGQFGASPDKAANLRRLELLCERATTESADLVVFPEAAMFGGRPDESLIPIAEPLSGSFVTRLREAAARHGLAVVVGIFELTGDGAGLQHRRGHRPAGRTAGGLSEDPHVRRLRFQGVGPSLETAKRSCSRWRAGGSAS